MKKNFRILSVVLIFVKISLASAERVNCTDDLFEASGLDADSISRCRFYFEENAKLLALVNANDYCSKMRDLRYGANVIMFARQVTSFLIDKYCTNTIAYTSAKANFQCCFEE